MRVGVFGGTFDPVHYGHLLLAEQCREQAQLDRVLFMVAARPPHKQQPMTSFERRVEMLELAISGQPAFAVDQLEKERPGLSYTVETLAYLQERGPGDELFLMMGADSLKDLPIWYEPAGIVKLATLLVVGRPGHEPPSLDVLSQQLGVTVRCHFVESPLMDLSSRDIRRRVSQGKSIRYQVPRSVEAYIDDKEMYREV